MSEANGTMVINVVQPNKRLAITDGKSWFEWLWLKSREATGSMRASLASAIATRKAAVFSPLFSGFPVACNL